MERYAKFRIDTCSARDVIKKTGGGRIIPGGRGLNTGTSPLGSREPPGPLITHFGSTQRFYRILILALRYRPFQTPHFLPYTPHFPSRCWSPRSKSVATPLLNLSRIMPIDRLMILHDSVHIRCSWCPAMHRAWKQKWFPFESPNIHVVYACSIPATCLAHSSFIPLLDLHDHTTYQIDSRSITNRPS